VVLVEDDDIVEVLYEWIKVVECWMFVDVVGWMVCDGFMINDRKVWFG